MKKVFVAMSGGVDSSVAAALLKDQGYDVTGVFMKFWSPDFASASSEASLGRPDGSQNSFCLWKKEREDALLVAAILDIRLLTWDFTKEYEDKVVDYMIDAYKRGVTPNPDLMCNKEIKFGLFFQKALAEGANLVATGHYARIEKDSGLRTRDSDIRDPKPATWNLLKAKDQNKDQSYFLYNLDQKHLSKTLFPVGEYTKPKVRELAKKYGLPTAEKKDSQGVCFIGPLKVREFLKERIKPKKGQIVKISKSVNQLISKSVIKSDTLTRRYADSLVLGTHDGVYYYTIGQRHGMNIKTGHGPYFVTGKDVKKNILYVGEEKDLYSDEAVVSDITWVGDKPNLPAKVGIKIRYRAQDESAIVSRIKNQELRIKGVTKPIIHDSEFMIQFAHPVRAITPGQAAVFYDGDRVLGGGTIS